MDEERIISEDKLEAVTGGSHLSSNETKSLIPGQQLILENNFGTDIALVSYEGELRDPGMTDMLQAKVRVIQIYDKGILKHGDTFSSWAGERALEVGDVIYVSRYYLDFPERA